MDETAGNTDGWVVARVAALERANRRLWTGLAVLGMTLLSVCLAGIFFVSTVELPAGTATSASETRGGNVVANDVTVRGALRVVDDAGRNVVWIGRESKPGGAASGAGQAVIGLFAGAAGAAPQQTIRLATSALGSALSLSTPDGADSASVFAGGSGVSLELRRGEISHVLSERAVGAQEPRAAATESRRAETTERRRSEAPLAATPATGEAARGTRVDLSDPVLQPLGNGFYVGRLSLSDQGGVLRVSGRLVNVTSVDQLRAEFRLSVAGRELPFSVGRIAAGDSADFAVELPSANTAALRDARMRWVRSTVSYLAN